MPKPRKKKPAAPKPAAPKCDKPTAPPKLQRSCFVCNGTGQMCNICGEAEGTCGCDELDMRDCEDCGGNGIASADQTT